MAGDGGGGVFAEYASSAEGGWGDFPGLLRIERRELLAGRAEGDSCVHRTLGKRRQEAGGNSALRRNHRAEPRGRGTPESLYERVRAIGLEEDGTGNLCTPGSGLPVGVEGDQGVHQLRRRGPSSRSCPRDALRRG